MHRQTLPLAALSVWSKLNDVSFFDVNTQDLGDAKGTALVTRRKLNSKETFEKPTLMIVPHDLILSAELVDECAKVDHHLRELLDVVGGHSLRRDVMLFLLMHTTDNRCQPEGQTVGIKNPWTEYVKFLPSHIPLPTTWSEEERMLLTGTSLETALIAKMSSLIKEFEDLQEKTAEIAWCRKFWWDTGDLNLDAWILLDAWYRSRCLELPHSGESMVPCLDMANHSAKANSYYEEDPNVGVTLLLRPDVELEATSEITISYGETKSKAEMLFSYGFIDENGPESQKLVLAIEPIPEDPLAKAKLASFVGKPLLTISHGEGNTVWAGPFLYFMCLNEEDGLEFKVLQETDGTRSPLRVFWKGSDVTEATDTFESLLDDHELKDVLKLRAVTLLEDKIEQQLQRLARSAEAIKALAR
ncbi:hypothetical protein BJ875DRAFT_237772 [Amylocarpus encephaloides]|uniref:SET domain-containing protein n=1 Tax=Amylocarpus encephaloides TaxID=45428 RepID=A0A9P7YML1_9HELO|nr:hypothetical protein BJ875DRAFT_237772 [Amylocarpus encephaloides]